MNRIETDVEVWKERAIINSEKLKTSVEEYAKLVAKFVLLERERDEYRNLLENQPRILKNIEAVLAKWREK